MVGRPAVTDHRTEMTRDPGTARTCPVCSTGELITISMTVNGAELRFTTCHACEAKWWTREGEEIPLRSVIGMVVEARS
jgi:DNA polymerase III alpha subunit (gram-positive type)